MAGQLPVVELRHDRRMAAVAAGASLLALGVGFWLDGAFLLGLGVVLLLVAAFLFFDRRVKLRIDEVGILYCRWGRTPVQWSEIESIETRALRGTEQVCVIPRDPALILERMPRWHRLSTHLIRIVWRCRFIISTSALEGGTPAAAATLRRYHALRAGS